MPKIIIIPGSTRTGSYNVKLARAIERELVGRGVETTLVSLADYPMPLMNEDLEEKSGPPRQALDLAELISGHHGVVLVNPEYNASMTPLMKNTLDWLSRDMGDVKPYKGRVFALASCSPGMLGGIRCLSHARDSLIGIGASQIISPQLAVGQAGSAFDDAGKLTAERPLSILQTFCDALIESADRYT